MQAREKQLEEELKQFMLSNPFIVREQRKAGSQISDTSSIGSRRGTRNNDLVELPMPDEVKDEKSLNEPDQEAT